MPSNLPAHFYMAPSSAGRWIPCPGSLRASLNVEDEAGFAAEVGTLGHSLVECELNGDVPCAEDVEFFESLEKDLRDWLQDAVDLCVNYVSEMDGVKFYETKIQHALIEEHGGTIDVIVSHGKTLHVVDFKFGRVKVDVEDNKQIKCYLNLARQMFPEAEVFFGSIIQPRVSDEMKTAEFSLEELDQHEADVIEASISNHFKAGDHCTFCPLLSSCETAAKHLRDQVQTFPDLTQFVGEVSGRPSEDQIETLCRIYKTFKLAEKATEGAAGILKRWAREGADLSPHKLGVRTSRRVGWVKNANEIMEEIYGDITDITNAKLMSPKEVQSIIGISKEQFEEEFSRALESKEIHSLVLGRDVKEFPEFPMIDD